MPAPSGITWGAIAGSYGRIGIYTKLSSYATSTSVTVEIWFWSKYSVSDSANTLVFDNMANVGTARTSYGSMNISTTVASGDGWSTSNQVKLKSFSFSYSHSTLDTDRYLHAILKDVDRVGAAMSVRSNFTIPKLTSYTVDYSANGGSGAPGTQIKWHGQTLTISSTEPTRTGYTFQGWATSPSSSVAYAAGSNYTANAGVTLYAVWKLNSYTVSYNANGGTGAPGNQTKTYGTALTLSITKPTRTNYTFKGWGTSASSTTVAYDAGASYTANAAITLYAVWELNYVKPRIYNFTVERCDADFTLNDDGKYALVTFNWETDLESPDIDVILDGDGETFAGSGTSGSFREYFGPVDTEISHTIEVMVSDGGDTSSATLTLNSASFPIDAKRGGKGVSFGKAAELGAEESLGGAGVADFAFDAKFNEPVYGKALGMDRLPAIPADSDLNDYMEPGCYAVYSNANAATIANIPVDRAGRLEVWSSTGEGVRTEQWSYLRQRYIPYNSSNAVWEREITRSSDNVWRYYDWWKSSLTPAAAEKVYSRAAITIALNANVTLGALNTYTKIPFDKLVISTSDRLTMSDGSIRIGADIEYVKVSGQVLVKCGTVTGTRHARIQKVSGTTTTSIAWCVSNATASSNTVYPFAPIIVPVKEGDLLKIVYYTSDTADANVSGSSANGWQTYFTAEEL